MYEFAWRRQLRDLRQPLSPPDELWGSIHARLDALAPLQVAPPAAKAEPPSVRRRRRLGAVGLAASIGLSAAVGWYVLRPAAAPMPVISAVSFVHWKPVDPRLAGATIELDAARMELQQALRQAPDSPALQRLLVRTERQQAQLRRLGREAG